MGRGCKTVGLVDNLLHRIGNVNQPDRESEAAAKYMLRASLEGDPAVSQEMLDKAREKLDLMEGENRQV